MFNRNELRRDLAQSFERYANSIQNNLQDAEACRRTVLGIMKRLNEFDLEIKRRRGGQPLAQDTANQVLIRISTHE
jgi:hypothetical protein